MDSMDKNLLTILEESSLMVIEYLAITRASEK